MTANPEPICKFCGGDEDLNLCTLVCSFCEEDRREQARYWEACSTPTNRPWEDES